MNGEHYCLWHVKCLTIEGTTAHHSLWKEKILIPHYFYRLLFVVSLVGSVITTPQMSNACQLTTTATRQETISGRLLSLNHATGMLLVETDTGIVTLEAAPDTIAGWKEGDPILVKIDATEQQEYEEVAEGATPLLQNGATATSDTAISR
jgi:hypothetical protein